MDVCNRRSEFGERLHRERFTLALRPLSHTHYACSHGCVLNNTCTAEAPHGSLMSLLLTKAIRGSTLPFAHAGRFSFSFPLYSHLHKPSFYFALVSVSRFSSEPSKPRYIGCCQPFAALILHYISCSVTIPPKPVEPRYPETCCGSTCVNCVWEIYFSEMSEYKEKLEDWEATVKHLQAEHPDLVIPAEQPKPAEAEQPS